MKVTASYEFDVPDELVKRSIDEKVESCIKADPDIVKVVRCKDCKHRKGVEYIADDKSVKRDIYCELNGDAVDDDWFCADGKRRPEDEEQS